MENEYYVHYKVDNRAGDGAPPDFMAKHYTRIGHIKDRLEYELEKLDDSSHECYADGIVSVSFTYTIPDWTLEKAGP